MRQRFAPGRRGSRSAAAAAAAALHCMQPASKAPCMPASRRAALTLMGRCPMRPCAPRGLRSVHCRQSAHQAARRPACATGHGTVPGAPRGARVRVAEGAGGATWAPCPSPRAALPACPFSAPQRPARATRYPGHRRPVLQSPPPSSPQPHAACRRRPRRSNRALPPSPGRDGGYGGRRPGGRVPKGRLPALLAARRPGRGGRCGANAALAAAHCAPPRRRRAGW